MNGRLVKEKLKHTGKTMKEIADSMNISPQALNSYFNAEDVGISRLQEIARAAEKPIEYFTGSAVSLKTNGVPYYDIDVTATITTSFSDVKETPEFFVDFKPFNDCTAYLPIYGDSMFPTYPSGDVIAVKEWKKRDVILWGEAYLIVTNEEANNMRTVKLVFSHDDPDMLVLRASNPNYKGDTIIPKKSITAMYIVKGKITRKQL